MLNLRPSKIQLTRRNLAWAAAIGILAAGLRILWLAREPLFIDEFADLEIARRSVGGITRAKDGFPPLFALLAHGWMFVFGTLESVRLLSVILGVGAVALCAIAGGLVAGERGAAFAGLFAAVNPLLVFHAQEGRAYGLVPFVTAWLVMAALALMTGRVSKAWWINLGLGSIAAVWTHYFLWVVVAIVGVILFICLSESRSTLITVSFVIGLAAVPVLALFPGDMALQADLGTMGGASRAGVSGVAYAFLTFLVGFGLGPSSRELHGLGAGQSVRQAIGPVVVFTPLLGLLGVWTLRRLREHRAAQLLAGLLVAVLVVAGIAAAGGTGFRPRYVNWGVIPLIVLAGVAVASSRAIVAAIAVGATVSVSLIAIAGRHDSAFANEDVESAIHYVERADRTGGEPVVVVSGYLEPLARYYTRDSRLLIRLDELGDPLDLRRGRWLLYSRPFHEDPKGDLLVELQRTGRLRYETTFAGVDLYRLAPLT